MKNSLNNLEIGEKIRSTREAIGLSREKFSEIIDISYIFLGQIERVERSLSLKTLSSIVFLQGFLLIFYYLEMIPKILM